MIKLPIKSLFLENLNIIVFYARQFGEMNIHFKQVQKQAYFAKLRVSLTAKVNLLAEKI